MCDGGCQYGDAQTFSQSVRRITEKMRKEFFAMISANQQSIAKMPQLKYPSPAVRLEMVNQMLDDSDEQTPLIAEDEALAILEGVEKLKAKFEGKR